MLTIKEFLTDLHDRDVKLWLEHNDSESDVRLRCNAPKGILTPEIRSQLADRKAEIINFLQSTTTTSDTIQPVDRTLDLPLSFAQTRLWFLNQLDESSATYNIPVALELNGALNIAALERSILEIVRRHEILRTSFHMVGDTPVQVIVEPPDSIVSVVDMRSIPTAAQATKVQQLAETEAQQPFDLSDRSLLRVTLLQLSDRSYVLLVTMHHTISDGWSMGVFIQELTALYAAYCAQQSSPLPALAIQYADFAYWQRQWLTGDVLQTQLNYWRQLLTGAPPLLELPTRPRPSIQTFRGNIQEFQIDRDLTAKIAALSQQSGATLFMTLMAAFATLLYRYSGQTDIVIGSPIANRNREELESLIGFFVNTLVLRTQLQGNPSFLELQARIKDMTLDAQDRQDLPFEKLVEELQPKRSLSYTPLFQVMFVLQNTPMQELSLPGLTLKPLDLAHVIAKFDLTLSIAETEIGLEGAWEYNTDLFDRATIERMSGQFHTLLAGIVANPQLSVAQLPLLSEIDRSQLLVDWNQTQTDDPLDLCFHQLFEAQVARNPDAIAVVCEDRHLTYQQLNDRANRWARGLVERGVAAETLVALMLDRNIDLLTAMLAVFKAGGAYLPLNPHHPAERVRQVLAQSQVSIVLSASYDPSLAVESSQVLSIEELDRLDVASENLPIRCTPDNLAYVIYTSGSTGKPKGAMLEQRGMLNHLYAKVQALELTAADVVAQTASQTFDISIWQFLVALLVGGRVEIVTQEIAADPAQLLSFVDRHQISILEIVPSLLRMMLPNLTLGDTQLNSLRWLLLTGETLPPELCRQWFAVYPQIPMMNAYGPTECSDDVTHYPLYQAPAADILNLPIGRPVANTQLYILDSLLQPVPIGVAGELYVGGVGVGRGYLNDSELTQLSFIPNPFAQGRMYKTGDKARYLSDGNIEFLGRLDDQVKVRGFRIELGEIEAVLTRHHLVDTAVVIVREDTPNNQHLVAYVVPSYSAERLTHPEASHPVASSRHPSQEGIYPCSSQAGITSLSQAGIKSELREFLKQQLPDYMRPSAFILLESIPLTPNGKVDRRALPAPELQLSLNANFVPPRTAIELQLMQIWEEVLHVHPIGIRDNFFDLGGHSLLAVTLTAKIQQYFDRQISLAALFQGGTIEELAVMLAADPDTSISSTIIPLQPHGTKPPFFCVHPGGGTVLAYLDLAQSIDPDRPFYGLESLELSESQQLLNTVEAMAAHYIEAMQTVQPQGPYAIGGWSLGGLVAFEMAQQLQAQGQELSCLALLDTYPFTEIETFDEAADTEFIEELLARSQTPVLGGIPEADLTQAQRLLQLFKSHIEAANQYTPQPYPGKVTLLLAADGVAADAEDPTIGWENLARAGVEIHWLPGDHHTMVAQPHVQQLAAQLQSCLDRS
jgi:amino acid adenylation domain-containing protein